MGYAPHFKSGRQLYVSYGASEQSRMLNLLKNIIYENQSQKGSNGEMKKHYGNRLCDFTAVQ